MSRGASEDMYSVGEFQILRGKQEANLPTGSDLRLEHLERGSHQSFVDRQQIFCG